jgi:hypothetical protein
MADHISNTQMEALCARSLEDSDMAMMTEHLAACAACQRLFQDTLKKQKKSKPIATSFSTADWFRHDHLDYVELESLAKESLNEEERQIINLHLETCADCREDVRSFLEFWRDTEYELRLSYAPEHGIAWPERFVTWWRLSGSRWKLAYTTATLLVLGFAILAAIFSSKYRSEHKRDQNAASPTATSTTSSPLVSASSPSFVPATPETPDTNKEKVISLNDGGGTIQINDAGIVSGSELIPVGMRQLIHETLSAGIFKKPAVLDDLKGVRGALKGNKDSGSNFQLLSPPKTVIAEDRPTFRWTPLEGASSYQVQIGDPRGNESADSGQLSPGRTNWTPPKPLKRGIVYTWIVIATVGGEEITSPSPSAPEMRFKVIEKDKVNQLAQLKSEYQSHLALGIFYAREGMIEEAQREFRLLAKDNPDSPVVARLLHSIQSWR